MLFAGQERLTEPQQKEGNKFFQHLSTTSTEANSWKLQTSQLIITKKTSPHKLFWGAMPAFQEHGQCHVLHARWDRQTHLHQSQLHLETNMEP